jgi:hypothetical protein
MKHPRIAVLFFVPCLLAAPMLAQTTIGGGTCNSATANGVYAVTITGRQVTTSGNFTNVIQANGSATFDGLSKVTIALTQDTGSAAGTPVTWSGTYTVQSNCAGAVTINSGGSATFTMALDSAGSGVANSFLLSGSDATYFYSGSGNIQPSSCAASTFAGVYTINGTGYSLSSSAVNGAMALAGLLQFDGHSVVTANLSIVGSASSSTLTGSYSVSSNCLGSAMLTDSKGGSYVMSFSVYSATKTYSADFYVDLAQNSKFIISGTGHAIYGQPSASTATEPLTVPAAGDRARGSEFACRRVWA